MADGFMSSWSAPAGAHQKFGVGEETGPGKLPKIHFHAATLMSIRRALLFSRPGEALGVLRGYRSSHPDDDVLFDALIPESATVAIRPGAVVVPVGLTATTHRPWRDGRKGGDGSLLKLFGAVASAVLLEDGHGVRVTIRISLPRFELFMSEPLTPEESPRVADVSLGIVLRGGDTVREGEHIGFLVMSKEGDVEDVVEPVLLTDSVGRRAIVGMWTLTERDMWAAAAVFAADSTTRRNAKVSRPSRERSGSQASTHGKRRNVDFLVARFHEHVGGEPTFISCRAALPSADEAHDLPFIAHVAARAHDPAVIQGRVISGDFTCEPSAASAALRARRSLPPLAGSCAADIEMAPRAQPASSVRTSGHSHLPGNDAPSLGTVASPEESALSPASVARSQLQNLAQQMLQLKADLGDVPPGAIAETLSVRPSASGYSRSRDVASSRIAQGHASQEPSGAERSDHASVGQRLHADQTRVPTSHDDVSNALRNHHAPGMESDVEVAALPNGIRPRLDALARKYLGENYWTDLDLGNA